MEKKFSYETYATMSFILMKKIRLWCPIMKRKEIIMCIHVYPNSQMDIISKKMVEGKAILMKQKNQFIYPNKENEFMVPNHEKKGYYYMSPCLSELIIEL